MLAVGVPPPRFDVCVRFGDEQTVVEASGEVDLVTAPQLGCVLAAVVGQARGDIVLDLAEVAFMDLAGMRVIATASTQLRQSRYRLMLRSLPAMIRRLLDVTGLGRFAYVEAPGPRVGVLGPEQRPGDRSSAVSGPRSDRADLTTIATVPNTDTVVDAALRLVVALASTTIGGADGASVSLDRGGHLRTVAATDETVSQMDCDQYATAQGPCVAAATEGRWYHAESLATEARWPDFTPLAIDGGIGSILSNPLLVATRSVGALNIYSRSAEAFGPSEQDLAAMFAAQASGILADARIDVADEELGRRLQGALRIREVIAQAQGVLMERMGVGVDEASTALRRSALDSRAPLRQRAASVVASARRERTLDPPEPGAGRG